MNISKTQGNDEQPPRFYSMTNYAKSNHDKSSPMNKVAFIQCQRCNQSGQDQHSNEALNDQHTKMHSQSSEVLIAVAGFNAIYQGRNEGAMWV